MTDRTRPVAWLRNLSALPAALLALLPSATCPLCAAAYVGVFSAMGLGYLLTERILGPLIAVFLLVALITVGWFTRRHRRPGPLLLTVAGTLAVAAGRLVLDVPLLVYSGAILLLVASLWNLFARRRAFQVSRHVRNEGELS